MDLGGGVEPLTAMRQVADRPDRVAAGDQRSDVGRSTETLGEDFRTAVEPDRRSPAVQRPPVARIDHGAAACGDHPPDAAGTVRRTKVRDRRTLEATEIC